MASTLCAFVAREALLGGRKRGKGEVGEVVGRRCRWGRSLSGEIVVVVVVVVVIHFFYYHHFFCLFLHTFSFFPVFCFLSFPFFSNNLLSHLFHLFIFFYFLLDVHVSAPSYCFYLPFLFFLFISVVFILIP